MAEPRRKRLIVGMPMGDMIYPEFFTAFLGIKRGGIEFLTAGAMMIHVAHNHLIKEALKRQGWDYLVFLETDHIMPPNFLERISYYDAPVVGATYFLRDAPHSPCVHVPIEEFVNSDRVWSGHWKAGESTVPSPSHIHGWLQRNQLFRVLAVGMGCTAIRRDVLEEWPKDEPWFAMPLEGGSPMTDDIYFCRRASQLGHEIYLDAGMPIGHIGKRLVSIETHFEHYEREARIAGLLDDDPDRASEAREAVLATLPRR